MGAWAAGLGCAVAAKEFGVDDVIVLDRHEVGASFRRWPQEMRFITPSFTSNAFGLLDLNAIVPGTSPAYTLDREHPSGASYAMYLDNVVQYYELQVKLGIDVCSVAVEGNGTFTLTTADRPVRVRHVIWAAGEFQYPNRNSFVGAESCCHSSEVRTWQDGHGDSNSSLSSSGRRTAGNPPRAGNSRRAECMVEIGGLEPPTSALRTPRSPS